MKIIISHDVDHLYPKDHVFRDLYFPKLWVRTSINFLRGKCKFDYLVGVFGLIFSKRMHRLFEVMELDKRHGVKSTFFFGMRSGLGMSYRSDEAKDLIDKVVANGFGIGVHGISYNDFDKMKEEYDEFIKITGSNPCGIRMHYVRYDRDTFILEDRLGYLFDSSEFDKRENGTVKSPYKVENMWEFPLGLMDVYMPDNLDAAKMFTINRIKAFQGQKIGYMTILFHDNYFSRQSTYLKEWYQWLINYINQVPDLEFISFEEAIEEMEGC